MDLEQVCTATLMQTTMAGMGFVQLIEIACVHNLSHVADYVLLWSEKI